MPITMQDVADRAGVSKAAVSLVLNDKPGTSTELRAAVLKAAQELDYHLPERRTIRPNLVVVHCVGHEPDAATQPNGIYLNYLEGIKKFTQEQNLNLTLIASYFDGDAGQLGFHLLNDRDNPPDGLILMGLGARRDSQLVQHLLKNDIPAVAISRNWHDLPISSIGQDHAWQTQVALEHLIDLGHRQIAFVAQQEDLMGDWFQARLDRYRTIMTDLLGDVDEDLIAISADGTDAVKQIVARRPDVTAIFAIHDQCGYNVIRGLRELGLDVPCDLSVVSLDGIQTVPDNYPPLTVVTFPAVEVGYMAANLLYKQLAEQHLQYFHLVMRCQLIEKETCGIPRSQVLDRV